MGLGTKLEGTPLRIYAYLLRHGPAGPREVARAVGLRSPSLAYYHLRKLEEAGLVRRLPGGEYEAITDSGIEGFVVIGKWLVPRLLAYAGFFAGMLVVEVYALWLRASSGLAISPEMAGLVFVTSLSLILFLAEGLRYTR